MLIKIKELRYEFFITSIAQGLYLLQNVVQTKIFTSYFETWIFGQWSLLISAYTLVSMIPFSAFDQAIYRFANKCKNECREKQLYTLIGMIYFTGFTLYTVVFAVMQFVQREKFFADGLLIFFVLYSFTEILKNTYVIIDNAYRNRKHILFIRIFDITSRTAMLLIFYKIGIFSISNVLLIFIMTNGCVLLYQRRFICQVTFKIDKEYIKQLSQDILSFSGPLLIWSIFGWMQNMISRWYLEALLGFESVAEYAVLTSLSFFFPNAVYTIVNAYVMPIVFQKNNVISKSLLLKFIGVMYIPMLLYLGAIVLFGEYFIVLLTDEKYLKVYTYLPYTTLTAIMYVIAMLSTVEIYRRGETRKLIITTILPGLFMATIGYFLIKGLGFDGAVISYMMGHIIYLIGTYLVVFDSNNIS